MGVLRGAHASCGEGLLCGERRLRGAGAASRGAFELARVVVDYAPL